MLTEVSIQVLMEEKSFLNISRDSAFWMGLERFHWQEIMNEKILDSGFVPLFKGYTSQHSTADLGNVFYIWEETFLQINGDVLLVLRIHIYCQVRFLKTFSRQKSSLLLKHISLYMISTVFVIKRLWPETW